MNKLSFCCLVIMILMEFFAVASQKPCSDSCRFTLVESMPENLVFTEGSPHHLSIYDAHKRLISLATKSIHLSTFYWTLQGKDISYHDNSSYQGEDILYRLKEAANRVDLKIAENNTNADTAMLAKAGAQVRTLDFKRLMGAGVLHTKMWIVDDTHMFVGSANFDWRSYTQIMEIGVLIENCACLVQDAAKLFEVYWYLGQQGATVPDKWPSTYSTQINMTDPLAITYNASSKGLVYLSSSPPPFCPMGRTKDLDAILNVIHSAKEFIYVSVMDYVPVFLYTYPQRFWPVIDDALRSAAFDRKVKVCLMASHWAHTQKAMYNFMKSLSDLNDLKRGAVTVKVKLFTVPAFTPAQSKIPFARVNHEKYMVTDQHAYIGTSNWSGDYFTTTAGVGFVLYQPKNSTSSQADLRQQLQNSFERDFYSEYAKIVY